MKILPEYTRKPLLLLLAVIVIVQFYTIVLGPILQDDVIRTVAVVGLSAVTWIALFRFLPLDFDADEEPWR